MIAFQYHKQQDNIVQVWLIFLLSEYEDHSVGDYLGHCHVCSEAIIFFNSIKFEQYKLVHDGSPPKFCWRFCVSVAASKQMQKSRRNMRSRK